jgi:GrpB-like predicted nucleotidyltransferase (UPF0157 family)
MNNGRVLLYRNSAIRHIIKPLIKKGYKVELVGSLSSKRACSEKDIDILLHLPKYPLSEQLFNHFEKDLLRLGWEYIFTDDNKDFGLFHNYRKRNKIGLDIWINEAIK